MPPSNASSETGKPGYITDYVSGKLVRDTPEEREAVQVFSRRLVEEFDYPKSSIQTRPQFRVRPRPSESRTRGYPVDITVFDSDTHSEDNAHIIVECKRKSRSDGEKQLKLYLTMSSASIGVWFNGEDHLYLHKNYQPDGSIQWVQLPTIPKRGQTIGDIGSLRRKELDKPRNLKAIFRDIRNHLAGNTTGITRDQALAQEIMSILFCKIFDEIDTPPDGLPEFRTHVGETPERVENRLSKLFARVQKEYADVFSSHEVLSLDPGSIQYVVGELQNYALTEASRDAIGEAFEVFIGPAIRGEEGQFFTPRNVVQMMISLLDPMPGENVIDPACGSGGFLIVALEHIWTQLEAEGAKKGWSETILERKKRDAAARYIRGIDKDQFLTKVTKAYMAIIGDGRGGIYCEDSLERPEAWNSEVSASIALGSFDVLVTNPPFGSKIKVRGNEKLQQYDLAHKWKGPSSKRRDWEKSSKLSTKQPPQVLFIERSLQLLRDGGRMGIILPESIFGMPTYRYIVEYLLRNVTIRGFVSLPDEVFQPYTHAKTCVLLVKKERPPDDYDIEMAIADWCGHDSRGNPTTRATENGEEVLLDDLPKIAEEMGKQLQW